MLYQVALGAVTKGVNHPTLLALNVVVGCLWLTLAGLLYGTAVSSEHGWLAPHFGFMLALCTFLWAILNWFIANCGLTSVDEQEQEFQCLTEDQAGPDERDTLAEELKELPLQSDLDLGISGAGGFDTSSLEIQNLPGTTLLQQGDGTKSKDE